MFQHIVCTLMNKKINIHKIHNPLNKRINIISNEYGEYT